VIALLGLFIAPLQVVIVTPRGETVVPVTTERGAAAVAAPCLAGPLDLTMTLDGSEATVGVGAGIGVEPTVFVFQVGAPFVRASGVVYPLVSAPYVARDTLFLPLDWLAIALPRASGSRYRWDAGTARLEESAGPVTRAVSLSAKGSGAAGAPNPVTGLRLSHSIVIDPGHGGADPGNPGLYFPNGLVEKDITLRMAKLLRAELARRGLAARLTRTTDTLIDLADRGAACSVECDLFISIHVNSMPPGRHRDRATGVETYFLSDAKTEDQARVAKMENDAIRFETGAPVTTGPVGFILRDLQANEYLRESARLAQLVQQRVSAVHPGGDRGVQQAAFMVLTTARRPAILVETGFATNPSDATFLASSLGEHRIAGAIADGVVAYLLEFERKLAVALPAGGR
jgi:N-acetylmuramoyl-L-alanine amidase